MTVRLVLSNAELIEAVRQFVENNTKVRTGGSVPETHTVHFVGTGDETEACVNYEEKTL